MVRLSKSLCFNLMLENEMDRTSGNFKGVVYDVEL